MIATNPNKIVPIFMPFISYVQKYGLSYDPKG